MIAAFLRSSQPTVASVSGERPRVVRQRDCGPRVAGDGVLPAWLVMMTWA